MTIKTVSEDTLNSDIEYCIDEYVRKIENRNILREHWFQGKTLQEIAADHNKSLDSIKRIIYDIGDKILIKANKM